MSHYYSSSLVMTLACVTLPTSLSQARETTASLTTDNSNCTACQNKSVFSSPRQRTGPQQQTCRSGVRRPNNEMDAYGQTDGRTDGRTLDSCILTLHAPHTMRAQCQRSSTIAEALHISPRLASFTKITIYNCEKSHLEKLALVWMAR